MSRIVCFILALLGSSFAHSGEYWGLEIPVMEGATNLERIKIRDTASYHVSYGIVLDDHRQPIDIYGQFFESHGWEHHMREVYSEFTYQFDTPPMQEWSSTSASTVGDAFVIQFGTMWHNQTVGSDATLAMRVAGLHQEERFKAHIEITVRPSFDFAGFMDVTQSLQANPRSMLMLSKLVGGDPFQLESFDVDDIDVDKIEDPIIQSYLDAVKAVLAQIKQFADVYIPAD